ncbi:hypothetical protein D3C73_1607180 [compost metagenome]
MRDKRPDADHFRLKIIQEQQILCKMPIRLPGETYHKARPHLITDLLQDMQAMHPVLIRHAGMQ